MSEEIKGTEINSDKNQRHKSGSFVSIFGIAVNFFLALIKFIAGMLSGSIAIMADSINNLSDAGSSVVSLISFKIAAKPADRDHPFGHARIEYIASLVVSFLILYVGIDFLVDSFGKIINTDEVKITVSAITVIILSVSIAGKLMLSFVQRKIGRKINSSVIVASSVDSLMDAISTCAVLISSIVIWATGFVLIDAIVGLGVSVVILLAGVKILNETKNSLLGEAPVEETVRDIEKIVAKYPEIIGIHDMLVHNYGPGNYFASFHAEVDGAGDIFLLHDAIDNVEKEISTTLGILCTVHLDPIVTNDETVNALRDMALSVCREIDDDITLHDFRCVVGATHTNIIFDIVLPYESKLLPRVATELIQERISNIRPDVFCVITVDRG
ncbi:MAG: cation transporter [Clostridia bacterium]|nr:cation transporter [Clostridia bacterium]